MHVLMHVFDVFLMHVFDTRFYRRSSTLAFAKLFLYSPS